MHPLRATAVRTRLHAAAFALVTGGALIAYPLSDARGQALVFTLVIAISTVAGMVGALIRQRGDRALWVLATVGLFLQLIMHGIWPRYFPERLGQGDGQLADLSIAGAHFVLLAASILLVLRHATKDPGGVIDAALVGLLACTPLWQWLLLPRLQDNGASSFGQVLVLLDVLFLAGILGSLGRIATLTRRARPTLGYLVTALLATMAGVATAVLTPAGREPTWQMAFLIVAFLSFGAAPLHPSATHLLIPVGRGYRGLNRSHLVFLGVVLLFSPVAAIAQTIIDRSSDPLTLAVGSVITVPLVLVRVAQLSVQRDRVERILAHHARHDELTSLLNRRAMLEEIDDAAARVRDGELDGVALLFCDLDGFKAINDRLGHQAGDELLQVVAGRLVTCTREVDVVGRLGGDEFLILCRGGDDETIQRLAERIDGAIRTPMEIGGEVVAVGVSVGVAVGRGGEDCTRDALISAADARMYRSKRERRPARAERAPASSIPEPRAAV